MTKITNHQNGFIRALLILIAILISSQLYAQVKVKGYYRKDGTYVKPHYRSSPDSNPYNNWSYPGNTNPYTGKKATGNSQTYLKNYYKPSGKSSIYSSKSSSSKLLTNESNHNSTYFRGSNVYYVSANSLNVRSGPSTGYSIIGSLSKADNVRVVNNYANGWKKIEYSYWDHSSFKFTKKLGYVSSTYLSKSYPYFDDGYSRSEVFATSTYSTLERNKTPYGNGNGNLTIWTNCGSDGEIKVYLNEKYIGKLTTYFSNGKPECSEDGTLSLNKPAGTYNLEAKGNNYTWSGTITISENKCLVQKLNLDYALGFTNRVKDLVQC